jgi:hypothetical protein
MFGRTFLDCRQWRYDEELMYRHGDVLIAQVGGIPAGAHTRPGAVVAHGEITGHSHRFEDSTAVQLYALAGDLFAEVLAPAARIVHEEHGPISIPRGTYRIWRQREYSPREIRIITD